MNKMRSLIKSKGGWNKIAKSYLSSDYSDNFKSIEDFLNNEKYTPNIDKKEVSKLLKSIEDTLDYMYSDYDTLISYGVPVPKCVIVQAMTNELTDTFTSPNMFSDKKSLIACNSYKKQFIEKFSKFTKLNNHQKAKILYNHYIDELTGRFVFTNFIEDDFWYDLNKSKSVLPIFKYKKFLDAHPEFEEELKYFEEHIEAKYNKDNHTF